MRNKLFNLVLVILAVFLLFSCSSNENAIPENQTQITTSYKYDTAETELMNLINNYRQTKGLNVLQVIDHISYKCEEHDNYMISISSVSHDYFKNRYDNMVNVLGAKEVSENLAYSYATSQAAFNAWLNSAGHRANIEGDFTHFGLAIRIDTNGKKYYTNIFIKK